METNPPTRSSLIWVTGMNRPMKNNPTTPTNPTPEHGRYADLILGMKRALNACENCDGDLDFAIFIIKKDIAELEAQNG